MKGITCADRRSHRYVLVIALILGTVGRAASAGQNPNNNLALGDGGPGIQVCEPVVFGAPAGIADFGSGCGEWLHWTMGFNPQLSQTPSWSWAIRACRELNVPRLRLTPKQGAKLKSILGITHVATGTITGSESNCFLTYQLYALPSLKPIGAAIKLSGSEETISKQLPTVAREILKALSVEKPKVPPSASVSELKTVGRLNWYDRDLLHFDGQDQVDALARKSPFAAQISFMHLLERSGGWGEDQARDFLRRVPGNFLSLSLVAGYYWHPPVTLAREGDAYASALSAPNSACVASWRNCRTKTDIESISTIRRMIRLAPDESELWEYLARQYKDLAESQRARSLLQISQKAGSSGSPDNFTISEKSRLEAGLRAVELDPEYERAWYQVSAASAQVRDKRGATTAFWKAYNLNHNDLSLLIWGVQLFKSYFGGDPWMLSKVVHASTAARFRAGTDVAGLAKDVKDAGYPEESSAILAAALTQARNLARRNPDIAEYHARLGSALLQQDIMPEAETELLKAVALDPKSALGHFGLGSLYFKQHRYKETIREMRAEAQITGGFRGNVTVADALEASGQYDDAEKVIRESLKQYPDRYGNYVELGYILMRKREYGPALDALSIAERLLPGTASVYSAECTVYVKKGDAKKALERGEVAVRLSPRSFYGVYELAKAYDLNKNPQYAAKMYLRAVTIAPNNPTGHLGLGEYYIATGRKIDGVKEINRCLALNPDPEDTKEARETLAKNK